MRAWSFTVRKKEKSTKKEKGENWAEFSGVTMNLERSD